MDNFIDKQDQTKHKFISRIAIFLFIGISMYLFISAIILLVLTKPGKEVVMPGVTGRRFTDVYNSLIRKGLYPEIKFYDVYDMDNGIILNQYPEQGEILYEGEKIKFTVSRNKINIPVPNLAGMKLPFAINKLKTFHYNDRSYAIGSGIISYIPSDTAAESVIIGQSPEAGEEITPDRKINLLVSAGRVENEMKMPDIRGQSIDLTLSLLLSKGLFVSEEVLIIDSFEKNGIIESQNPKPEENVEKGSLVKLKVYYYPEKEKTYTSYERITYTIPSDEKGGLIEAYVDDSSSKRIAFSRKMKPGEKIDFLFKRRGSAKITITNNKEIIEEINISPDKFN